MQLSKSLVALALLLASAESAPTAITDSNPNEAAPSTIFRRDSINDCGDSTFVNQSSGGSPTVNDCLQIATNIAGGGTWEVSGFPPDWHQLVQYGTCAFGVQRNSGGLYFHVGNQDIIDLIHTSVDKFSWFGLVGAKGVMPCEGDGQPTVSWCIYHT
jgi:hypothetical protein